MLGDVDVRACVCIASLHPLSFDCQRNAHDQVARCRSSTTAAPGRISKKVDAKSMKSWVPELRMTMVPVELG